VFTEDYGTGRMIDMPIDNDRIVDEHAVAHMRARGAVNRDTKTPPAASQLGNEDHVCAPTMDCGSDLRADLGGLHGGL
jgi:hypothetical protein